MNINSAISSKKGITTVYFRKKINMLNTINKNLSFKDSQIWGYEILTKRPIIATRDEIKINPRSRSAKLRIARYIC